MSKGRRSRRVGAMLPVWLSFRAMAIAAMLAPGAPLCAEESGMFDSEGYRLGDYRAPVPDHVPGAQTVSLTEVQALRDGGAILLDVMGLRRFHIAEDGRWITPGGHLTIAGAVWLPVVGWGALEEWEDHYLDQSLLALTAGDMQTRIVVFCKLDCWLSWNAARRLSERGYSAVSWFPGGTDVWSDAGLPLIPAEPLPVATAE